jgi:predicted ester cyclase
VSAADNTALVERYFETIWNGGELEREAEFVAQDITVHAPPMPGIPDGIEGPLAIVKTFRDAVPDLHLRNTVLIGEGDRVVQRWMVTGTHTGADLFGIEPQGASLTLTGINEFRIENGRIQERWGVMDVLGMLQQLGAVPDPTHSTPPEK